MATKKQSAEQQEAIARLRETLKPGDTVYCQIKSVSRSGMSRVIQLLTIENNEPRWIGYSAALAMGDTYDQKREGIKIGGCGMDMGFALVYNLARTLFHPFICTGEGCQSNDHTNAREGTCPVCGAKIRKSRGENPPVYRRGRHQVCSQACASGEWRHSDAGYALSHRWLL